MPDRSASGFTLHAAAPQVMMERQAQVKRGALLLLLQPRDDVHTVGEQSWTEAKRWRGEQARSVVRQMLRMVDVIEFVVDVVRIQPDDHLVAVRSAMS